MSSDMNMMKKLAFGLLGLLVVIGLAFLVGETFKNQLCTQAGLVYEPSVALDACNATAYLAVQNANLIQVGLVTLVGFVSLVVLISIIAILIKNISKIDKF